MVITIDGTPVEIAAVVLALQGRRGETEATWRIAAEMANDDFRQRISTKFDSQTAFAEAIGVDRTTVSKYLSGDRMPGVEILLKMAEVLGCEFTDCVKAFYGG